MKLQKPSIESIIVFLFLAQVAILSGKPVSLDEATKAAKSFICARYPATPQIGAQTQVVIQATSRLTIRQVQPWIMEDEIIGFVARLAPAGYVLMRADDEIPPIKIYSDHGAFSNLPPNFANIIALELMEELRGIHQFQTKGNTVDPKYHRQWEVLLSGTTRSLSSDESFVSSAGTYLLSTTWNQNDPYNYYAPAANAGPGGRAWAGCVAVAMAQIIRYHQSPVKIANDYTYTDDNGDCQGTHSIHDAGMTDYAYQNMPDDISTDSPVAKKKAIGQLLYHCAVTVEMNFESDGSGAYSDKVNSAYRDYFNYQADEYVSYADYSKSEWYQKIKADIDNNCPVFYTLYSDSGGHAIVCDGYADDNTIHLNLGWSGAYDAWYNMDGVIAYEFTSHGAVFGITVPVRFTVYPDIKINNSQGPVSLNNNSSLSLKISLAGSDIAFRDFDYWLAADTPSGRYFYRAYDDSWHSTTRVAHQGATGSFSSYQILNINTSILTPGNYIFYFGVDTDMNGSLDLDQLYYDYVSLTIYSSSGGEVSGRWEGISATGQVPSILDLNQTDSRITGILYWPNDDRTVSGSISGSQVTLNIEGGDIWDMTLSGNDNTMTGTGHKPNGGTYALHFDR